MPRRADPPAVLRPRGGDRVPRLPAARQRRRLEDAVGPLLPGRVVVEQDQGVRDRLAQLDITPDYAPGSALKTRLETEIKNWTRFVDAKGIRPE